MDTGVQEDIILASWLALIWKDSALQIGASALINRLEACVN